MSTVDQQEVKKHAQDLLDFIDASPSPWHAVASTETLLQQNGFTPLNESDHWQLSSGSQHYVIRGGGSIIAFIVGSKSVVETGFNMVGAHTDSPGLRLKPHAAFS
ncbi:MAG: M18 family aminopeptidase, partial [Candidatus Methylopumilus sp.]|nr:M18 family aminopeptidase [Candidatus Methylopumilus sp.]